MFETQQNSVKDAIKAMLCEQNVMTGNSKYITRSDIDE